MPCNPKPCSAPVRFCRAGHAWPLLCLQSIAHASLAAHSPVPAHTRYLSDLSLPSLARLSLPFSQLPHVLNRFLQLAPELPVEFGDIDDYEAKIADLQTKSVTLLLSLLEKVLPTLNPEPSTPTPKTFCSKGRPLP